MIILLFSFFRFYSLHSHSHPNIAVRVSSFFCNIEAKVESIFILICYFFKTEDWWLKSVKLVLWHFRIIFLFYISFLLLVFSQFAKYWPLSNTVFKRIFVKKISTLLLKRKGKYFLFFFSVDLSVLISKGYISTTSYPHPPITRHHRHWTVLCILRDYWSIHVPSQPLKQHALSYHR